jgi:hypothetical protein
MSEEHQKETVDVVEEVATEAAASALTALSIQPNTEMTDGEATDCEGSAFEIPERFTKSGRKKAVPFPVKVCTDYVGCVFYQEALSLPCGPHR